MTSRKHPSAAFRATVMANWRANVRLLAIGMILGVVMPSAFWEILGWLLRNDLTARFMWNIIQLINPNLEL
jgi:hypothetical protein